MSVIIDPMHTKFSILCATVQGKSMIDLKDFPPTFKLKNLYPFALEMKGCTLPPTSFADFLHGIGVNSTSLRSLMFKSGTNLSTLKKSHLAGLKDLTRVTIEMSDEGDFTEDFFENAKNLTWLSLKTSKIQLNPELFKPLSKLLTLELAKNDLQTLQPGLFKYLPSLKRLNIWNANIQNLTSDIFENLDSLEELDISVNRLETLPSDVFANLPNLKKINLSNNKFNSLPEGLFSNNPRLDEVKLKNIAENLTRLPDNFLSNLTELAEVQITGSNIQYVPESLMWHSVNIKNISFDGNRFMEIPENLFRDQRNLLGLKLQRNSLTHIHDKAFRNLHKLVNLNLDNNQLTNISNFHFAGLSSLQKLSMRYNKLIKIDSDAFSNKIHLEYIDMSYNQLTFLDKVFYPDIYNERSSPFQSIFELKSLILSHNNISEIFPDWRNVLLRLKNLDLSYNKIEKIQFYDVHFLNYDITVNLEFNDISEINFEDADAIALGQKDQQPDASHSYLTKPHNVNILIDNNPIICDCGLLDYVLYLNDKLDVQVRSLVNLDSGNNKCSSPDTLAGVPLKEVPFHLLLCPLDHPRSQSPICPINCTCNVRTYDKSLIVDCASSNLTLPLRLPEIKNYTRYTEFYVNNSGIKSISSLLSNQEALNHVGKFYLSNNNITEILPEDIPENIQVLDLRNNRISSIKPNVTDVLKRSTTLKQLMISGNPLICNCENQAFLSFLQTNLVKVKDYLNVTCTNGKLVEKLSVGDLCGAPPAVIISCVLIAFLGLMIGIFATIYYKYQLEIKIWLFAKGFCLWWITEKEVDKDKIYDAFISFSHKDEDFVVNELVSELEGGQHPFKLCVHFRDWKIGEYIPDQIVKSVMDSRRTLVILSPNFLDSVWGKMEFKTAHTSAMNEGRARVIIILYGDVGSHENLDPDLKKYLSTYTYIKWGDPLFWDKLRFILPHPPYTKQLMPTHSILSKKGFDDRLELIHPSTPGTPPGQNTPPAHQAHTNPLMNSINSIPNGVKPTNLYNGTITMNGHKVNGNAKHSDV